MQQSVDRPKCVTRVSTSASIKWSYWIELHARSATDTTSGVVSVQGAKYCERTVPADSEDAGSLDHV